MCFGQILYRILKSDDLKRYGLNKKAPNTIQDATNAQWTFVFFLRVFHDLLMSLLLYILVHVYHIQYLVLRLLCFVQREVSFLQIIIFFLMEVSLDQHRAAIGLFNRFKFTSCRIVILLPVLFVFSLLVLMLSLGILLLISGSVHPNSRPNSVAFFICSFQC